MSGTPYSSDTVVWDTFLGNQEVTGQLTRFDDAWTVTFGANGTALFSFSQGDPAFNVSVRGVPSELDSVISDLEDLMPPNQSNSIPQPEHILPDFLMGGGADITVTSSESGVSTPVTDIGDQLVTEYSANLNQEISMVKPVMPTIQGDFNIIEELGREITIIVDVSPSNYFDDLIYGTRSMEFSFQPEDLVNLREISLDCEANWPDEFSIVDEVRELVRDFFDEMERIRVYAENVTPDIDDLQNFGQELRDELQQFGGEGPFKEFVRRGGIEGIRGGRGDIVTDGGFFDPDIEDIISGGDEDLIDGDGQIDGEGGAIEDALDGDLTDVDGPLDGDLTDVDGPLDDDLTDVGGGLGGDVGDRVDGVGDGQIIDGLREENMADRVRGRLENLAELVESVQSRINPQELLERAKGLLDSVQGMSPACGQQIRDRIPDFDLEDMVNRLQEEVQRFMEVLNNIREFDFPDISPDPRPPGGFDPDPPDLGGGPGIPDPDLPDPSIPDPDIPDPFERPMPDLDPIPDEIFERIDELKARVREKVETSFRERDPDELVEIRSDVEDLLSEVRGMESGRPGREEAIGEIRDIYGEIDRVRAVDESRLPCSERFPDASDIISELEEEADEVTVGVGEDQLSLIEDLEEAAVEVIDQVEDDDCAERFKRRIRNANRKVDIKVEPVRVAEEFIDQSRERRQELLEGLGISFDT